MARVPIVYNVQYWTLVFPLGMYTVATDALIHATGLKILDIIPRIMVYASLFAWILTFVGMLVRSTASFSSSISESVFGMPK